jgi:5'(3')-deoxyribonucleotidase
MAIADIMPINLFDHQKLAIEKLKSGSILCGGVGSGKSRTALYYYFVNECGGSIETNGKGEFSIMKQPKDLYIITTAKKRDTLDWERECAPFLLSTNQEISICGVKLVVDSWNNIGKYVDAKNSFFIFDEQRVVGSGAWVKSFIKICKENNWLLLSATPGDTWMDYIPVFIANGFYKNRTEFIRRHVVYSRFAKYPKVDHYVDCGRLVFLRNKITVIMHYSKRTISHNESVIVGYDREKFKQVVANRWNIFKDQPIKDSSELCYTMRRIVNSDNERIEVVKKLILEHSKVIIFYNFNYELDILREVGAQMNIPIAECNGHKHENIPSTEKWIYLVQYNSGAEGWECIETDAIIFYSQNYSYKMMIQAAGRIDRLNTPFSDLYYYHLKSSSPIDAAISRVLESKQDFNEEKFIREQGIA